MRLDYVAAVERSCRPIIPLIPIMKNRWAKWVNWELPHSFVLSRKQAEFFSFCLSLSPSILSERRPPSDGWSLFPIFSTEGADGGSCPFTSALPHHRPLGFCFSTGINYFSDWTKRRKTEMGPLNKNLGSPKLVSSLLAFNFNFRN